MSSSESRSPDWRCRTKALLFIALLMFDVPGARAVRSDFLDDAGMSEVGTSLRGGDKIEDPFEQYVEHRGFVQEQLDNFGTYTGLIPQHRKEAFRKAVSYVIGDDEIFQAAQFAVCVRTSPTPHKDDMLDDMEVRCTPAVDILDSTAGRTSARRMSLYNVYNELLDFVNELEEPTAPSFWSRSDENQEKDLNFAEYFHAYANLKAASYNKPSLGRENDIMKDVLRFPMKFQFKEADGEEEDDSDEEEEWPPYLPDTESRYMLCFGELAAPGQMDFSGEAVKKACTGFWNRDVTKDAIAGLGARLRKENMEHTMFRVRSEILFGKEEGEGDQSLERTFHLLAGAGSDARSARGVAEAVARLVRERIAVTGVSCPRCVAEALGISSSHDQAASLTESAEGSSALVEANESAIALREAARPPPPVFAVPPVAPPGFAVPPVAPVVHHAAPAFQVITPGLVNPAGQHLAVQAAGHAHVAQLAPGVVHAHANFGGVVTHYVPVTQVLSSGMKGGWHFITHGGHQIVKMKAAGAKSCMGLFHLKGSAAVTTDVGLKLAMKKGVLCLATKVVTHGTAAGVAAVTPWAAISAALTVHVAGITIPAALVVSAVVLVSFATAFGTKWISDQWKNRMAQRKLREWQLLVRSSAITPYWVARA